MKVHFKSKHIKKLLFYLPLIFSAGLFSWSFLSLTSTRPLTVNKSTYSIAEEINNFTKTCTKQNSDCYKNLSRRVLEKQSSADVFQELEQEESKIPPTFECHLFAHYLGQAITEKEKNLIQSL